MPDVINVSWKKKETELWAELCVKQPLLRNRQKTETKHTFLSPSSGFVSGVFESKFWDEVLSSKLNWIGQHWRPSSRSWRRSAKSNIFIFCCHLLHEIHVESKYNRGSINFPYMPPNTVVRGKGKPRRSLQKKSFLNVKIIYMNRISTLRNNRKDTHWK